MVTERSACWLCLQFQDNSTLAKAKISEQIMVNLEITTKPKEAIKHQEVPTNPAEAETLLTEELISPADMAALPATEGNQKAKEALEDNCRWQR